MSLLSIKGILIGNLFALAAGLTTRAGFLMVFVAQGEGEDFAGLANGTSSSGGVAIGLALSGLIALGAGFLSARVAERGELTNGVLSSIFMVAQGVYAIVCWPDRLAAHLLGVAGAPLLGLLGGYLHQRRARRSQAVMPTNAMPSISIKGLVIGALTNLVASWVLGFGLVGLVMASYGADNIGDGSVWTGLYLLTLALPPLAAGYVSAAVAGKSELINGTLVGMLCALVLFLFDAAAPLEGETVVPFYLVTLGQVPVLCFIGACLYLIFGWPKRG